jgi:hypothetical protein
MKQLTLLSLTLTMVCLFFVVPSASAHVLKTDGNIGAILHINPDDNPVSGIPTDYILYFDDITNRFALTHCDCRIIIQENGQTIATQALTVTTPLESDDTYTFPGPNVYTLVVSGQPKAGYQFQPFVLNYLVRVEGSGQGTQPFPMSLWVGLGMMIVLIIIGVYKSEYS